MLNVNDVATFGLYWMKNLKHEIKVCDHYLSYSQHHDGKASLVP